MLLAEPEYDIQGTRQPQHEDPTKHDFCYAPLYWALKPGREILELMWFFGPLIKGSSITLRGVVKAYECSPYLGSHAP